MEIFLQRSAKNPYQDDTRELVCSFADDGYYWFLHPLFEKLREETGEYIDLYGWAVFNGDLLDNLAQTIEEARMLIDEQVNEWDVVIGFMMQPIVKEMRNTVSKQKMQTLIHKLSNAVMKAKANHQFLVCFGD